MNLKAWPAQPASTPPDVLQEVLRAAQECAGPDVGPSIEIGEEPGSKVPVLLGELPMWDDVVAAGRAAAKKWHELRGTNTGDVVVDLSTAITEQALQKVTAVLATSAIPDSADVIVVGAGICGLVVALGLADAGLRVAVLEGGTRIAGAATAWNNGMVHPGHDPHPGTLKAELNIAGNAGWARLAKRVGMKLDRRPSLLVGFGSGDADRLAIVAARARTNGVPGAQLISGAEARTIEPRLSADVSGALLTPSNAAVNAVEVTEALAREVRKLGGTVTVASPVSEIITDGQKVLGVRVGDRHVTAPIVVNAAGIMADVLAATAGSRRYSIHPRRGTLVLFDPGSDNRFNISVGPIPGEYSKGGGMTARPDGLTTGGPTAVEQKNRIAEPATQAEVDHILALGANIFPDFPLDSIVNVGTEVRAATYGEDFVVGLVPGITGLIDVAGTQSPAIASAPAIADYVVDALARHGHIPIR